MFARPRTQCTTQYIYIYIYIPSSNSHHIRSPWPPTVYPIDAVPTTSELNTISPRGWFTRRLYIAVVGVVKRIPLADTVCCSVVVYFSPLRWLSVPPFMPRLRSFGKRTQTHATITLWEECCYCVEADQIKTKSDIYLPASPDLCMICVDEKKKYLNIKYEDITNR